jgi:two-component system sensor histidine kinase BaeS
MRWSSGITPKLFLAVLVTNVVTALAVGFGVRAAFNTGFEDYVREREDQRLTRLAGVVANAYREAGAWDFLKGNDALWVELNHQVRPSMPFLIMRRPPPRDGRDDRPPPTGEGVLSFPGQPRERREDGPPREMRIPPAAVVDNAGLHVVGEVRPDASVVRKPVVVDGARVGWLVAPVRETVFDVVDRRFQQDQLRAGWIVGLVAVALSAIVAWFLARGMIAPVRRLAAATRRLADGDYATRVAPGARDEIGALVDDFNRLGNALDKHEKARRNLMADVSHELRTPLAVLKGELEAIEDGVRPVNRETIASLQGEVARLA